MILEEIRPYVRYARFLELTEKRYYPEYIPVDCRLFYVCGGEGKIETGGECLIMPEGSMVIINSGFSYHLLPANVRYLALNFDYTQKYKHISIPIPPVNASEQKKPTLVENVEFKDFVELNKYLFCENMHFLKSTLLKIESEYSKKLPYYGISTSSALCSVIVGAVRNLKKSAGMERKLDIDEIISYLHEHYNEPATNDVLAGIFHFHPNYINAVFKKNLGKSLHQYIIGIRISNAIAMLEEGVLSIDEIASATGFYDSSYFSRYFKRVTGVSPKYYR